MKPTQLEIQFDDSMDQFIIPGKWMPSFWNENTWYYQDKNGYQRMDPFDREKHTGSMLPAIIPKCNQNQR